VTAFLRRVLPVVRREARRGAVFKARSAVRYQPGEKMRVPSETVANTSTPKSMPVSWPVAGSGWTGASTQEQQPCPHPPLG
jgi:hypothetical protein